MAAPTTSQLAPARLGRQQWILLGLLVVAMIINYLDRGALAVGQGYITKELHIDPKRLGMIFSAFFWTYATCQIVAGILVDRWPVNRVYGAGYFIWSVAMLGTAFAGGLGTLLGLRLLLGAGESVAYPSYSRILAATFREDQRGFANAMIDAASKLGPAVGVLVGGLTMEVYGWRAFFFGMGALSLLWLIPWTRFAKSGAASETRAAGDIPSLARILRMRSAWGTFIGLTCSNYAWYFMVFWLPPYFVNERHFSQHDMAILGSAPFWGVALTSIFGGWFSDRWIARGGSPTFVRKTMVTGGLLLATLILPAMLVREDILSLSLLTLACASFGLFTSNVWAITQTIAGPYAAGKWTGLQNAIGNIPGMVGLWFTGWVIEETGHYVMAFVITCGFLIMGAISFLWIVKRVEPADWSSPDAC